MGYTIPPRLTSVLHEASTIAPHRRVSSDGTIGDAAHRASGGDHNPDPITGIVHAVDVSESMPGTPYWQPSFDQFDVHAWQRIIAAAYVASNSSARVSRWPWLALGGYMVGFDGSVDCIFNPSVSLTWRQNGAPKQDHNQHGHFSIAHDPRSEQDTQAIFVTTVEADMPLTDTDVNKVADEVVRRLGRQKDGSSGVIGDEVKNVLGGYSPGGQYVDGLLVTAARQKYGLSKP